MEMKKRVKKGRQTLTGGGGGGVGQAWASGSPGRARMGKCLVGRAISYGRAISDGTAIRIGMGMGMGTGWHWKRAMA